MKPQKQACNRKLRNSKSMKNKNLMKSTSKDHKTQNSVCYPELLSPKTGCDQHAIK